MTVVDPNELYEGLISGKVHPAKRRGLAVVHGICRERFDAKATDWSVSSIGREAALRGGPGAPTLHQPRQEYYRALIKAWESYSQSRYPRAKQKAVAEADQWIHQIEDISSRQMALLLRKDLDRARAEIQLLKKLVPNGGVIRLGSAAGGDRMEPVGAVTVPPSARRDMKKFVVEGLLDEPQRLKQIRLTVLKGGDIVLSETGEILFTAGVVAVLRSIAKLADA
jgi:hypothetical protein